MVKGPSHGSRGNDHVDLKVWRGSQAAVVVSSSNGLVKRAGAVTSIEKQVEVAKPTLRNFLYGLRLQQWLKNLLVFLPLAHVLARADIFCASA